MIISLETKELKNALKLHAKLKVEETYFIIKPNSVILETMKDSVILQSELSTDTRTKTEYSFVINASKVAQTLAFVKEKQCRVQIEAEEIRIIEDKYGIIAPCTQVAYYYKYFNSLALWFQSQDLVKLLTLAVPFITKDSCYTDSTNGILLSSTKGALSCVSSERIILVKSLSNALVYENDTRFLLTQDEAKLLCSIFRTSKEVTAFISLNDKEVRFSDGNTKVFLNARDENYPEYESIITENIIVEHTFSLEWLKANLLDLNNYPLKERRDISLQLEAKEELLTLRLSYENRTIHEASLPTNVPPFTRTIQATRLQKIIEKLPKTFGDSLILTLDKKYKILRFQDWNEQVLFLLMCRYD